MPWATPTLRSVREMVRDGVRAMLPGSDANVPNSLLRVMSDAMGALCHLTLQYIDWLSKQLLPDTAEKEWLDRHGKIWLVNSDGSTGRKVAAFSSGLISCTGNLGVVIPNASQLITSDGLTFATTAQVTLGSSATQVPVKSLDPGADSNLSVNAPMSFVTALPGVNTTANVIELYGGADEEADDELRARILQRIQQPPMGGDAQDYVKWVLEVPGVTRAWCSPLEMGIGTVTVRFMMDDLRDYNSGIPMAEDVAAVEAFLDTQRPVAVKDFFVAAPIPYPINLSINQLVSNDVSTQANIEAELKQMFLDKSIPGSPMYHSWVDEAISSASGEVHHELNFQTTYMPSPGHLAIVGSIIYAGG
jgi:uncharacterized phage protein gp47/JayE